MSNAIEVTVVTDDHTVLLWQQWLDQGFVHRMNAQDPASIVGHPVGVHYRAGEPLKLSFVPSVDLSEVIGPSPYAALAEGVLDGKDPEGHDRLRVTRVVLVRAG